MTEEAKKKAIGFPFTENGNNCFGIVLSGDMKYLGHHTSSSYSWLKQDLAAKAKEYDFEFINEIPTDKNFIIYALINHIAWGKND